MKLLSVFLNIIHAFASIAIVIAGVAKYLWEGDKLLIEQKMFMSLQVTANTAVTLNYLFYIFRKSDLVKLCDKYEELVNRRLTPSTAQFYEEAEWKSAFCSKWICIILVSLYDGGFLAVNLFSLCKSLIIGDVDVTTWPTIIHIK